MKLWNLVHGATPFHVYELLALLVGVLMLVLCLIHYLKNKPGREAAPQCARTSGENASSATGAPEEEKQEDE